MAGDGDERSRAARAQDSASTWDFFLGVKESHWGEGVCEQGTGMV